MSKTTKDAKRLTDDLLKVMDQIQTHGDSKELLVAMIDCMVKAGRHKLTSALLDMVGQESCLRAYAPEHRSGPCAGCKKSHQDCWDCKAPGVAVEHTLGGKRPWSH